MPLPYENATSGEPLLMPVKPRTLSDSDKLALRELGVFAFDHPNPEQVRLLRSVVELNGSDLLLAAMRALNTRRNLSDHAREDFAKHVLAALEGPKA